MKTIKCCSVELSLFHNEIVGKIQFVNDDNLPEQSQLYSLHEIRNILSLWKIGGLLGYFAIGTTLAENAEVDYFQRG